MTTAPRRRKLLVAALFVIATAAVYVPWLSHAFIWDDFVQITENGAVRNGVPIAQYFTDRETTSTRSDYNTRIYRPLRNLAFRWVWKVSELSPTHRAVFLLGANLLLYLASGWLVMLLCLRLARDEWAALLAAGLWLLLPVHVEDVLYASALGDLLSCALQLGALVVAIRCLDAEEGRALVPGVVAVVLFLLAVFVKEMAITSVLILPVFVLSEERPRLKTAWRARAVALVVAHGIAGVLYMATRTKVLGRVGQEDVKLADTLWGIGEAPWLLLRYLKITLMPFGHAPDYGVAHPAIPLMVACTVGGLALFAYCNLRPAGGVRFGAWLFVLSLVPVLHLVPLWTMMADRFALVPSVGVAMIAGGLIPRLDERRRPLLFGLLAFCALVYTGATAIEARRMASDETLFAYGVMEVPESGLSNHNYGLTLLKQGQVERALKHLTRAELVFKNDPRLYHHLAGALEALGRYDEAMRATNLAIKLKPDYGNAYAQRAALERRKGDLDAAQRDLEEAGKYVRNSGAVERQMAALDIARGDVEGALKLYETLVEHGTRDPSLWQHLAECARHLGKRDEAANAIDRCLELDPGRAPCLALKNQVVVP